MQQLVLLFAATLSAAFIASLPPGLLNMNAAKTSVEKGKKNGITFGFGVGVMTFIQAYLAVRISKFLSRNSDVIEILMQAALVIFGVLAIFFFIKGKKQTKDAIEFVEGKKRGSFSKGLFLAALNLLSIPYYAAINTFFHGQGFMNYAVIDEVVFIISAGLGAFLAMYLYVFYFDKMELRTNKFSKNANYILSGLMVFLFVITLFRLYF
jgi:threonine/homoserine/homoserine lactone efflux protein